MLDRNLLRRMLSGRVVVACVGNDWRCDDGVGPFVGKMVRPTDSLTVLDCGETPEKYLGVIARLRPEKVVVVDAADFGGAPGEIRAIARDEIGGEAISTHAARLVLLTDYVEASTGAQTFFVAIQPESLEFGAPMGSAVSAAARSLAEAMNRVVGSLGAGPGAGRGL
jgi:hydrogenase 3 maturation protease